MSRIYEIEGVEYPSVTTILDTLSKGDRLLHWASDQACNYLAMNLGNGMTLPDLLNNARSNFTVMKDEACSIGTEIHHCIESHIQGVWFNYRDLRPEVKKGFFAFLDWKKTHWVKFINTEFRVYSKIHCYAGTLDAIVEYEDRLYIADWKSSNGVYDTYPLQLAGYREAAREMGVKTDGQIIVRLDKTTGKYETYEFTHSHEKNLNAFLKLVDFWFSFKSRRLKGNPRANSAELKARMVA